MGRLVGQKPPLKKGGKKKKREALPSKQRILKLERWKRRVDKNLSNLESVRLDMAKFVFEIIAIVIAMISLLMAIIFGMMTSFIVDETDKLNIIITCLIILTAVSVIWLLNFLYGIFYKKDED